MKQRFSSLKETVEQIFSGEFSVCLCVFCIVKTVPEILCSAQNFLKNSTGPKFKPLCAVLALSNKRILFPFPSSHITTHIRAQILTHTHTYKDMSTQLSGYFLRSLDLYVVETEIGDTYILLWNCRKHRQVSPISVICALSHQ